MNKADTTVRYNLFLTNLNSLSPYSTYFCLQIIDDQMKLVENQLNVEYNWLDGSKEDLICQTNLEIIEDFLVTYPHFIGSTYDEPL